MTLATTVALAVVRGPVPVAKTLGAIDRLSGGRLVVAVGPGSSPDDYAAVGLDFSERWPRFDEAIGALRALWRDGRCAVRRPLLFDRGSFVGTPAGATARTADLGGELGLRRRASSRGPSRRRLAGVGLQHDAGAVRRSVASPSLEAGGSREGSRHVPERAGDDVVLHHRRPRRSRPHPQGAGRFPPCTDPRTCSANVSRSARPNCSPRS